MSAIGLPLDEGGTVPTLFLEPHTELALFAAEPADDAPASPPPPEDDPA